MERAYDPRSVGGGGLRGIAAEYECRADDMMAICGMWCLADDEVANNWFYVYACGPDGDDASNRIRERGNYTD